MGCGSRTPPYSSAATAPSTTTGTAAIARRPSAPTGASYSWLMRWSAA
ncbi:hypothetical protein ACFVWN_18995 [Nocardiopsis flavescens]